VSPDSGAEFRLRWHFPRSALKEGDAGREAVEVQEKLRWSSPSGRNSHRLGLQFVGFEGEARARLDDFVEDAMRP
jgi:hypothetical protein